MKWGGVENGKFSGEVVPGPFQGEQPVIGSFEAVGRLAVVVVRGRNLLEVVRVSRFEARTTSEGLYSPKKITEEKS